MEQEIWKSVEGLKNGFYDGLCEVSNMGRIKRYARIVNLKKDGTGGIVLKENITNGSNSWGYKHISFNKNGQEFKVGVHVLVATAFIHNPENKYSVNHIDGNPSNNVVSNLEWATHKEQGQHAAKIGLLNPISGENHVCAKLTPAHVRTAREVYKTGKYSIRGLAKIFSVKYSSMRDLLIYKSWKHVA